jgi:hypothetical protein
MTGKYIDVLQAIDLIHLFSGTGKTISKYLVLYHYDRVIE